MFSLSRPDGGGGNACVKEGAVGKLDAGFREALDKFLKEGGNTANIIENKKPEIISDISEKINAINEFYNENIIKSLTSINTLISDKNKKNNFNKNLIQYNILINELKKIIKTPKIIIDEKDNSELEKLKQIINTINTNIKDKGLQKIDDLEDNKKSWWDNFISKGGKNTRRRRHKISQNHKRTVRK